MFDDPSTSVDNHDLFPTFTSSTCFIVWGRQKKKKIINFHLSLIRFQEDYELLNKIMELFFFNGGLQTYTRKF
jgi:hypothetical protein